MTAVAPQPPKAASSAKPPSQCSYCEMTFKKLEHCQRHERTHTLDRPYACSSCGKTFARQDTLNRHARLHSRAEEGNSPKNRRKRINSVSSNKGKSENDAPANDRRPPTPLSPKNFSTASNFDLTLPVTIPSFPAYSRAIDASMPQTTLGDIRRGSDGSYASLMGGLHLDLGPATYPDGPFGRVAPAFDIVASPASASSSSEGEDSADGDYATSEQMESQYPSPAFSSYSPTTMHDTMADLEAILANDPLHSMMPAASRQHAASQAVVGDNEDFDFEHFAASVEGPAAATSLSFESLVNASRLESSFPSTQPTSSSSQPQSAGLSAIDFDFADFTTTADVPRAARGAHRSLSMSSVPTPSRGSLTMPSSTPSITFPSNFPSLSGIPNTLGLHENSPNSLIDSYLNQNKRKSTSSVMIPASSLPHSTVPAFYIPSNDRRTKPHMLPMGAFASI